MLNKEEKEFVDYWKNNRNRKKKWMTQFSIGLPIGVMIVVMLFINIISGWYTRAAMVINANSSFIIVILVAAVSIVVFITYFGSKHQWDINEQRYRELLMKENKE